SPLQAVLINNQAFYIKRDDLILGVLNGNKARKLKFLFDDNHQYLQKIISYGGIQSNFMSAIAVLAKHKNWSCEYYTQPIPKYLKEKPVGNYAAAIKNNIKIIETTQAFAFETIKAQYKNEKNVLVLDQGGRDHQAEIGLIELCQELKEQAKQIDLDQYCVFMPSGTGTSAYFLQKHLYPIKVYTTPGVGSKTYLISQMNLIEGFDDKYIPKIIKTNRKYTFGQPYSNLLKLHQKLYIQTNIEFDLLYDPIGWMALFENIDKISEPIIYIHCGGIEGNESMLNRYQYLKRKNKLKSYPTTSFDE
ncbi:hypothetical protein OAO18_08940, partial [Francisellaceae bacterium]|nr:hypothetical protein [Francisellaceae bacterium]